MTAWADAADRLIAELAKTGEQFSADDVIEKLGPPAESHAVNGKNNAVGSAFSRAAKAGLIQSTGYARSRTKSRKGGSVRIWRGLDASEALFK